MKRVCLLCERTSPNENLFCQESYCPAEMSPTILNFGEWLGDIEIVKSIMVLRSGVLYEANHQKQKVLIKVAHPGIENTERLKREALLLAQLNHESLPKILPAYANTTVERDAYGRTMLGEHLLYFYVCEFFQGESLRDVLTKRPQMWINHVGWTMVRLSMAVNELHGHQILHFGLSPESLLIHFDEETNTPRILLFDLGVASPAQSLGADWHPYFAMPAYTAPELVDGQVGNVRPDYRTDVYGLGAILYEMLVGEPPYTYKLRSDEDVYRAIQRNLITEMNRIEDVKNVANVAIQAVSQEIERRQQNAAVLAQQLIANFGNIPEKKKRGWPSTQTILVVVGALLAVAFLITFAISLVPPPA